MQYGYIKVAAAVPSVKVADCLYNVRQTETLIAQAEGRGVEIIVFPELGLTGYTCQDLFRQNLLLEQAEAAVIMLLDFTRNLDIISIVGVPVSVNNRLLNCAVVIQKGDILGIVPKTWLPNYNEFYEKRWFVSSLDINDTDIRFAGNKVHVYAGPAIFRTCDGVQFGIEICEDLWAPVPPSSRLATAGADIIFNLSASDELVGKHDYLKSLLAQQSARTISGYVYSSCGFGESTQDVVYGGNAMIYENGCIVEEGNRFSIKPQLVVSQIDVEKLRGERRMNTTFTGLPDAVSPVFIDAHSVAQCDFELLRSVSPHPFIPSSGDMAHNCEDILSVQAAGLGKRLVHTKCRTVVVGISGGLDSTLALLICVRTFDMLDIPRKNIIGVTMPGFGTTDRTYNNALSLMESLGVTIHEINIAASVRQHFSDIGHDEAVHDVTYENSQARERTQILMDLGNKLGGIVIGTGDLSELALGWATYNGDHKYLVRYIAEHDVDDKSKATLIDIIDTPISPELIPAADNGEIKQKTEDLVGPYELHDFFLYHLLRFGFRPAKLFMLACHAFNGSVSGAQVYDDETIKKWLTTFVRRFFNQQFKRSCLPDGPKVGSVSLSPRGDWRMPSDADSSMWLSECEKL